jgi:hypothetical protein
VGKDPQGLGNGRYQSIHYALPVPALLFAFGAIGEALLMDNQDRTSLTCGPYGQLQCGVV